MKSKICNVCGKLETTRLKKGMCRKHYAQLLKYGKVLDNNPRTIWDSNEIRVLNGYGEIDTYTNNGEVLGTFKFDLEDMPLLISKKWRTVFKGNGDNRSQYLVTGHTIYFHRLIMGNPNTEIDHINVDSTDNRKQNLRESNRFQQLHNTRVRIDNVQGFKGVYYSSRDNKYRAEIAINKRRYYSPSFNTIEEAIYMRFLFEQHFYKTIPVNTNVEVLECISKINPEAKKAIDIYFTNKAKAWVDKI